MEPGDLYGLPLDEFTAARNALAKERPEAKELRKPTSAAYAVNQLARRHAGELDAFLGAAAELRQAQLTGGDVRGATQEQRQALQRLLQLAGEYASAAQMDGIRQTLQAAAVDEAAAEQVRAGQLERELEPGGFGSLVTGPAPKRRAGQAQQPKRDRKAERAAVAAARLQVAEARRAVHEAEDALARAEEGAARARERLEAAEAELEEAERRAR